MTKEQVQQVLDELNEIKPEKLEGNSKRLFEAIMSIADEKDKLKKHNDDLLRKLRNRVKEVKKLEKYSLYKEEFSKLNKQLQNKDKIIDLMAERVLLTEEEWKEIKEKNIYNVIKKDTHKLIKQYFENKAKELLNK